MQQGRAAFNHAALAPQQLAGEADIAGKLQAAAFESLAAGATAETEGFDADETRTLFQLHRGTHACLRAVEDYALLRQPFCRGASANFQAHGLLRP